MEAFSALLAICAGNSPVPGEFPTQRPVTRSFDVYFDLRPSKRLCKQSWGWWFETLLCPLWRHSNEQLCRIMESSRGKSMNISENSCAKFDMNSTNSDLIIFTVVSNENETLKFYFRCAVPLKSVNFVPQSEVIWLCHTAGRPRFLRTYTILFGFLWMMIFWSPAGHQNKL